MVKKKQSVPDEATMGGAPAKAPTRSRGRPRVGDAVMDTSVGREVLIDATIDLLKDMPPSAITPVLVARTMGVHPSLIRYYFRNRATLLVAVAEKLVERFAAQFEQSALSEGSPESRLCARIHTLIDLNATYPFFHQLFATEIAGSEDPSAKAMITQFTNRGTATYGAFLRAGLADGSFRGMDPSLLYVAVVGMSEFFVSARRQMEIAQGVVVNETELREAYKAFVCDLVLNGVRARKVV